MQTNKSKQVLGVGAKGLTMYIVTTLVTYRTPDNYNGYIVKVKEKHGDKH